MLWTGHNKLSLRDIGSIEDHDAAFRKYLRRWFSYSELSTLERAFEGWREFTDWREQHPRDSDRMKLIAVNIINNEGQFVAKELLNT